jgi:hypothetical protein
LRFSAVLLLLAGSVQAWSCPSLDDPLPRWAFDLETAGLLRPGGILPDDALAFHAGVTASAWRGPLSALLLRSAGPATTVFREGGAVLQLGGGITGEALDAGSGREGRIGTFLLARGSLGGGVRFEERLSVWSGSDEQAPDAFPAEHMGMDKGRHLYVDRGFVALEAGSFEAAFGRIPQRWGPGRFTNLLLSDNSPALDMIRVRWMPSQSLTFTGFVSSVEGDSAKYLTAHRMDLRPADWLRLGLSEAVLFRSDGLDLAYMNPFIPWYPVQWNEREDDNAFLCADFTAFPVPGTALWGELLVDDLQYQHEYDRPNKLGCTVGAGWAGSRLPISTAMEYTRIDRYVYSQKLPFNYYLHDGRIIGSELGPDCDRLSFSVASPALWPVDLEMQASHRRSGEGTVSEGWPDSVSAGGPFPSGTVEHCTALRAVARWMPSASVELTLSAEHSWLRNVGHVPGVSGDEDAASVAASWTW